VKKLIHVQRIKKYLFHAGTDTADVYHTVHREILKSISWSIFKLTV